MGLIVLLVGAVADVTEFPKDEFSIEKIIERADNRMYGAKNTGRNKILIDDVIY